MVNDIVYTASKDVEKLFIEGGVNLMKEKICGIYMIKNLANNNVYIGQSVDIYGRWGQHRRELKNNSHTNQHLQRAWNKYGPDYFDFVVIERCDKDSLNDMEIYWIKKYDSCNNGYNMTEGGHNTNPSAEVIQKLSESHKGIRKSDETRKKIGEAQRRKVYCPELDEVFSYAGEVQDKYGIDRTSVTRCCNGKLKSAGQHPITGELLRWVFDDERHKIKDIVYARNSAVYCIELDEIFSSMADAGRKYNVNPKSIAECCSGRHKSAGKHPITGEKLHWIYADKMNNSSVA